MWYDRGFTRCHTARPRTCARPPFGRGVRERGTPSARSPQVCGGNVTSNPRVTLPPQPRQHSLDRLEEEIVQAETTCTRWRAQAEGLEAAGRNGRQVRGLLAIAEERLARLGRSREVLLRGEDGEEEDEPA